MAQGRVRDRVLGCPVDIVDIHSAVDILVDFVEARRRGADAEPAVVVTLNPEMVMRARRDPIFRSILDSAALLIPDGIGLVRALRRRGNRNAVRVGGIDLLEAYLPLAVRLGHRVAFAGAPPGVAQAAAARLASLHPGLKVVATDSGSPDAALAARLREASPEMVWAAFGAPVQEAFLRRHLPAIGAAAGIGVGGSLDYFAGRLPRAPGPIRNAGFEWAWRLVVQPSRVRRQAVLPLFWCLEHLEAAQRKRVGMRGRAG
jgi:N-acetylglucosaminyldiphosphoundecaprenol N-acetyl-beta-D-mannosaminyltransferase